MTLLRKPSSDLMHRSATKVSYLTSDESEIRIDENSRIKLQRRGKTVDRSLSRVGESKLDYRVGELAFFTCIPLDGADECDVI